MSKEHCSKEHCSKGRCVAYAVGALCWALVGAGGSALAAEAGGEPHAGTWLNWLSQVRVGGRPVVSSPAGLAFAWSVVVMALLMAAGVAATRRLAMRPRGLQTLLELLVGGMKTLVVSIMGPRGVDFVPFIGTLFIFIAVEDLLGLLPGFISPTSSLSITAALAIVVFVVVQFYGLKEHGLGYLDHFIEGVPRRLAYAPLAVIVFVIHVVGELFRPVTLAVRLFGNIMAGEMVVLVLIGMAVGVMVKWKVPLPLQVPNLALEVLVSIVQATVFALLTTVYLSGVVREREGEAQHG